MKTTKFFTLIFAISLFLVSCENDEQTKTTMITFEDVNLTDGFWNGSDESGSFSILDFRFNNSYSRSDWGDYWSGFACSAKIDTKSAGYTNQYSVIAGEGVANSKQFALVYDSASIVFPSSKIEQYEIKKAWLTNSTYAYFEMLNGGDFTKKFANDDWFVVIITGYLNDVQQSQVKYYLADFRDGKSFIADSWQAVDLSALSNVDRISFTFDSSDKGIYGVNTPKYVCIYNIEFVTNTIENKQ
jgi:hypothetical protein